MKVKVKIGQKGCYLYCIDNQKNKYFIYTEPTISFSLLRMRKILRTFAVELIRIRLSPTYSHYFGAV